jgi:nicotinic acid mononucleotide adenylyltransferase
MAIGIDNANKFDKWVNYTELERMVRFVVIPRKGFDRDFNVDWYLKEPHIFINSETDIMDMSSSYIRNKIQEYRKTNDYKILNELELSMNKDVVNYILENNLY